MTDQRAQYDEEAVGANHPTKADVVNRLALVEHNTDGTHKITPTIGWGIPGVLVAVTSAVSSFLMPCAGTIVKARAYARTAPVGGGPHL